MVNNITDDEMWEIIGFVKVSSTRMNVLRALKEGFLMPSEISKRTDCSPTLISNALQELKNKKLVRCMNENAHKGRIYQNTELGLAILNMIDNNH